jgi:hypothetical protein
MERLTYKEKRNPLRGFLFLYNLIFRKGPLMSEHKNKNTHSKNKSFSSFQIKQQ